MRCDPLFPNSPPSSPHSLERIKSLRPLLDPTQSLAFTGATLSAVRKELVGTEATLLGFVGTPWTLAAYAVEGKSEKDCKETKVGGNGAGGGG